MKWSLSISLAILVGSFAIANGQEIGTEICSCSPTTYEFTLDFSLTCPPVNITTGDGVEATSCLISPFGDPSVEDLIPVAVEGIDILELGQNLRVVEQTDIEGELLDGDTFTYTAMAANPDAVTSVQKVPRALQLNIVGRNALGFSVINVFIVTFTNDCDSYPVFEEGQTAGWVRFTDIGAGSPELCPAVPTSSPTGTVTLPPAESPTDSPTLAVSSSPTDVITDPPTDDPTASPTEKVTDPVPPPPVESSAPTDAPVTEQTNSPTPLVTTEAPVSVPTENPTLTQTDSPTPEPTPESIPVTEAPVDDPTEAPVDPVDPTEAPVDVVPTDFPTDFSMSMSMQISAEDIYQKLLLTQTREFGKTKTLRAVGTKKEKSEKYLKKEKSAKASKEPKKSDKYSKKSKKAEKGSYYTKSEKSAYSTKSEKAVKGYEKYDKKAEVRVLKRLRRGFTRLRV